MIYLDSSAIIKLVVAEPESNALRAYLAEHEGHVSSGLARVQRRRQRGGAARRVSRLSYSTVTQIGEDQAMLPSTWITRT